VYGSYDAELVCSADVGFLSKLPGYGSIGGFLSRFPLAHSWLSFPALIETSSALLELRYPDRTLILKSKCSESR